MDKHLLSRVCSPLVLALSLALALALALALPVALAPAPPLAFALAFVLNARTHTPRALSHLLTHPSPSPSHLLFLARVYAPAPALAF